MGRGVASQRSGIDLESKQRGSVSHLPIRLLKASIPRPLWSPSCSTSTCSPLVNRSSLPCEWVPFERSALVISPRTIFSQPQSQPNPMDCSITLSPVDWLTLGALCAAIALLHWGKYEL